MIHYELLRREGLARRGRLTLARGTIETPAFMPVGLPPRPREAVNKT